MDKHSQADLEGARNVDLDSDDPGGKEAVRRSRIGYRAILLGILLIPLDAYWVIRMEKVLPGPYPTTISLFANAVLILALFVLVNALVRYLFPKQAFSQAELLVTYTMVCIGAALAGHDMIPILIQMMAHPYQFATPENQWMELFGRYLPNWTLISDPEVLRGYHFGNSSIYRWENLSAWLKPALAWVAFVAVLVFVISCINTIVRRQWVERERLTFPVVQLPLHMTEPGAALWKSKLMWLGFAIAGGIDLINGLHYLYPALPMIPIKHDINLVTYMTSKPWNAIGWMPVSFYPFVIGLGYLLPTDLLFSCWFFYLFWKAQLVVTSAMAWDAVPNFPFIVEQTLGAYVAIVVMLFWTARGYLKQVWLRIIGAKSELDDSAEPMSYRAAAVGILAGLTFLVWFVGKLGMSPLLAIGAFLLYFILATVISRMRAELGPPVHDLHFAGPDVVIPQTVGTENIDNQNLTALSFLHWFNRAYRGHPAAFSIESMKMAQVTRSNQRTFLIAVLIATVVGGLAAFWAYLDQAYALGTQPKFHMPWFGGPPFQTLEGWIRNPVQPKQDANMAIGVGFLSATFLAIMRMQIIGWPFHPIGYAISGGWSMNLVWLPLFIAWVMKVVILKFGGLRVYKQALPFFLGLILGQMIVGSLWSLIGIAFGIPTYSFWGG
jgi:hypothetical protein